MYLAKGVVRDLGNISNIPNWALTIYHHLLKGRGGGGSHEPTMLLKRGCLAITNVHRELSN